MFVPRLCVVSGKVMAGSRRTELQYEIQHELSTCLCHIARHNLGATKKGIKTTLMGETDIRKKRLTAEIGRR